MTFGVGYLAATSIFEVLTSLGESIKRKRIRFSLKKSLLTQLYFGCSLVISRFSFYGGP